MQVTKWTSFKNHLSSPGRNQKKIVRAGHGTKFLSLFRAGPGRDEIAIFAGRAGTEKTGSCRPLVYIYMCR